MEEFCPILDTGPLSIACIANIFLNISKKAHSLQQSLAPETGMNPEKVTNVTAVGVCSTQTPICCFLLEDLQCPSTLDAANHHEG